jgi:hypothetical protein
MVAGLRADGIAVDEPVWPPKKSAATAALRRRFAELRPDLEVSPAGYVSRIVDNLLSGVEARHFVEHFKNGDGRELDWKFCAVHSSAALAVNAFARFKDNLADLSLADRSDFEKVAFEVKCPIGLRGGRPAHLDLLAQGPAGVVAVESKCTEHLGHKAPSFSPAYSEQIRDERRAGVWFRAMETVLAQPDLFGFLDVAQLIKHAFGLARCFRARPTTLLYLCWEPLDADRHPMFRQHRREIERFSDLVAGGFPAFRTQSYSELWAVWQEAAQPKWLRDHAAQLVARYAIPLDGG